MKIFVIPIETKFRPASQTFRYPSHNKDYGVEQDFLRYLSRNPELVTLEPTSADWHYLPVYWTRWHINHNFAVNGAGLAELETAVKECIIDERRTFTITQFDGGTLLRNINILEFTAAKTINAGIDIPILCSEHRLPIFPIRKKFLGSFNGSFTTHPLREEMRRRYPLDGTVLIGGNIPTRFLKRIIQGKQFNVNTLSSYVALCPRGTSCNSFRFFEAMQLGVAPCLIGDHDVRPFKKYLNWDNVSFYAKDINELEALLNNLDLEAAIHKGKMAKKMFYNDLFYQKWCKYIIKELNDLQ